MTRTIIAPTDFSTASLNAVNYAAELAVAIGAELLIMNIVPMPVSTVSEVPAAVSMLSKLEDDSLNELSRLKNQLILITKGKIDINCFSEFGAVEIELEKVAKFKNPFVIVMNVKDNMQFQRFFFGSITLAAVKYIPYPVLIIPEACVFKNIHTIALATDLESPIGYKVSAVIIEWLTFFAASLDVVTVTKKSHKDMDVSLRHNLQNQLAKHHPSFHFITNDATEDGIREYIQNNNPDLLIMFPKSRGPLEEMFHASQSKPFLLHSTIPVLAISDNF
jgi:nucleotide-binding universal stress UspA family protein